MKFIVSILLIAALAFALGLYLPWWSVALSAFAVSAFVTQRPLISFFTGFLGIFFLWFFISLVINSSNNSILATRVASILPLGGSPVLLMIFTAFIGGLVGGMAALTASFVGKK